MLCVRCTHNRSMRPRGVDPRPAGSLRARVHPRNHMRKRDGHRAFRNTQCMRPVPSREHLSCTEWPTQLLRVSDYVSRLLPDIFIALKNEQQLIFLYLMNLNRKQCDTIYANNWMIRLCSNNINFPSTEDVWQNCVKTVLSYIYTLIYFRIHKL